jgi:hypothetical protein
MNKDDTEALELVRDFLRTHGLKSTLECLEKEENYKNIGLDKKSGKVTFNCFNFFLRIT